jgi:NAD+ synthase/NAD+ synthase (glutamine-hydrolysing)
MKIKLCEINTIPGDFEGNTKKIIEELNSNDDVYIFPELSIPGYLCQDLMYFDDFINKNLEYLDKIRELAGEKIVVVGLVTRNLSGEGKPFYNSAAVIMGGHIIGFYHKMLLPFYDVFHEPRYFEPGTSPLIFKIGDLRCGVVICEDAWNDKGQEDYNYHNNPIQLYRDKVDIIFSLNSSPWYIDKHILRREMLEQIVESWNKPLTLVYTNQIGGQDDLVFDGNSMIVRGCNGFSETIKTRNYDTNQQQVLSLKILGCILVLKNQVLAQFLTKDNFLLEY